MPKKQFIYIKKSAPQKRLSVAEKIKKIYIFSQKMADFRVFKIIFISNQKERLLTYSMASFSFLGLRFSCICCYFLIVWHIF